MSAHVRSRLRPGRCGASHTIKGNLLLEERIVGPDPVDDPDGYKEALLALLGGRDPLEVMSSTPERLREGSTGLGEPAVAQPPSSGEWSVQELLAHFWHAEIVYAFRWRAILAQESPRLIGYDQDAWTSLPYPGFPELLEAFSMLRRANVELIRSTADSELDRAGLHEERGPESVRLGVRLIAGHDLAHLEQLHQTVRAVS